MLLLSARVITILTGDEYDLEAGGWLVGLPATPECEHTMILGLVSAASAASGVDLTACFDALPAGCQRLGTFIRAESSSINPAVKEWADMSMSMSDGYLVCVIKPDGIAFNGTSMSKKDAALIQWEALESRTPHDFGYMHVNASCPARLQAWDRSEAKRFRKQMEEDLQANSVSLIVDNKLIITGGNLDAGCSTFIDGDSCCCSVVMGGMGGRSANSIVFDNVVSDATSSLSFQANAHVWLHGKAVGRALIEKCILAICDQVDAVCRCSQSAHEIEVLHFHPPMLHHTLTLFHIQSHSEADADGYQYRRMFHDAFMLPSRPLLRPGMAGQCTDAAAAVAVRHKPLVCVHNGLPRASPNTGTLHMVDGLYEYYHYMQQGEDDKGWGCAYRSLQTLCSWLKLQGYVDAAKANVPTIADIQRTLVKVGDKDKTFIGSSNWIGAMECSFVLDELYGVECKILNVSSGHDLADQGRVLSRHFDTNGTPVMIGGGVLAYTLLGVDFNPSTGDIRFLILDPHYVGHENVSVIQGKGWVGWKTVDLFVKGAFYNLCMPQRPQDVI